MKIVELFRRLSYGELSNLAISNGDGTLIAEKHPQIAQYVNEGLLKLYSRFLLSEKTLILEQYGHVTTYHMNIKFAETAGSNTHHPYIKDLPDDPFLGDVIKILAVSDEDGNQLPLNDKDNPHSLFTPQPDMLQILSPQERRPLAVTYQARHPAIDTRVEQVLEQEIDIPFSLEPALQSYVSYKTYSDMNGQENIGKSQENLAAYEQTCTEVELRDLMSQSFHTSHNKLEQRGFV